MAKKRRSRGEPVDERLPTIGRVGKKHGQAADGPAKGKAKQKALDAEALPGASVHPDAAPDTATAPLPTSHPAEAAPSVPKAADPTPLDPQPLDPDPTPEASTPTILLPGAIEPNELPSHLPDPATAVVVGHVASTPDPAAGAPAGGPGAPFRQPPAAPIPPVPAEPGLPQRPEPDPSTLADPEAAGLARRRALEYETSPHREHFLVTAFLSSTPGLDTLRHYRRRWLRPDVFAGIAVAAYLVPQVMAYSAIVNVAPVVGLWTALAALVAYAVMGQSRMLSVGPESTVALMAGTAIAPLSGGDPQKAIALGAALSLVVAGWCFLARMARLGVVAELLSQPLLVGYLAGGAVLMVVGQLGKMTGTNVTGETIVDQLRSFASVASQTHPATLCVGVGTLVLIGIIHVVRPRWPAPLIAVAAATVVASALSLQDYGVAVVGPVPKGLPLPTVPELSFADWQALLLAGVGVAIVAYGDNTLIARGFPAPIDADEDRAVNSVDPQKELVALGGVHVAAGLFSGYPVSSSGSRTALALASGARTQLYSVVAAACVVIVLFVAGPLIANLPQAALGAVVFYAASKLISWLEIRRLARFRRRELLLAAATTLGTVLFGILAGVGIAIALSFVEMAGRLARPHDGVLGRVPGLAGMHDVADYPDAQTLPGLVVYRYDAPLFFANVADLQRRALLVVDQENRAYPDQPARWFILNVEANVEVDITAADGLRELHGDMAERGVRLGLARVKHDLYEPLRRAGLTELIGADMLFPTLPVAEKAYLDWVATQPERHPEALPSAEASQPGHAAPVDAGANRAGAAQPRSGDPAPEPGDTAPEPGDTAPERGDTASERIGRDATGSGDPGRS